MNASEIQKAVSPILDQIRKTAFVDQTKATDAECVGLLISKFFEWDGAQILEAAIHALEDANFHREAAAVEAMRTEVMERFPGEI